MHQVVKGTRILLLGNC